MRRNDDDNDTVMNWLLARGAVKIGSKVTLSKCNAYRVENFILTVIIHDIVVRLLLTVINRSRSWH